MVQPVLYVSNMELGHEVAVRAIHERFPRAVLSQGIGVERVTAYIGSGKYALAITVSDGDFQENFHRFLETPEIRDFFTALGQHVADLPRPGEETAEMPLLSPIVDWPAR